MGVITGLLLVMTGGLASGSFYIPFNKVRNWAWEIYWLVGGVFSWLIAPWAVALLTIPNLSGVFRQAETSQLLLPVAFGFLWGIGGLTFGLALRYLGIALGMALALGLTAAFGTLIPPAFYGELPEMMALASGRTILLGVLACLLGIGITGWAGMRKDKEIGEEQKKESVREFNLRKGVLVAFISGLMNACFAFGIAAGKPVAELAVLQGADPVHQNNPTFVLILIGGLVVNSIYCTWMIIRNGSGKGAFSASRNPVFRNLVFSALAGTIWFVQFFFYGMGESMMGRYGFAAWSILMSSTIVFSNLWGLYFKEWKGVHRLTLQVVYTGLVVLVISTAVIGLGTYLQQFE
jgi:L-rhamnose-H+ transport protein